MIPVLIIGAFSLILQTFPVEAYQHAISVFLGGFFLKLFEVVYSATFGILSVYMAFSISRSYMKLKEDTRVVSGGAVIASLLAFFILAGAYLPDFSLDQTGPKSMFLALVTGLLASFLYYRLSLAFQKKRNRKSILGAGREFRRMMTTLFPIVIVALIFGVFNVLITKVFQVDSFRTLLINLFNGLFSYGPMGFFKGFFFVMLSSILWFFGIHGSDTLEGVMQTYFSPGLAANQAAVAAGGAPQSILTKEFFDCFVLMGGCGATICLLIAILLFSRSRTRRELGAAAAFPMIFNINEMMVFGLPVILNPVMLIPFLLTPLVCYSVAYLAIYTGLVPMITSEVAWTTPVFLGGYYATGSIAGSLLQLVNIVIGVLIYVPFVRLMDKQIRDNSLRNFAAFQQDYIRKESALSGVRLTELNSENGDLAKELCNDIRSSVERGIVLAYQPQYHYKGNCMGVESLLRYRHSLLGDVYPPLVIKLAEEGGFLPEFEERVFLKALEDRPKILKRFGEDIHISVNITGTTVVTDRFLQFCRDLNEKDPFEGKHICIEITEQAALALDDRTMHALTAFHEMGLLLAIDDFSMGHTSIHYLRDNLFDLIKLDGALVSEMFDHPNIRDIISSLTQLAKTINMIVVAEYVDNEEKKEALHEIGCDCYQGYLYSPAVYLEEDEKPESADAALSDPLKKE